jgi:phosphoribosylformylglycinamidine synthase PurS subunit
VVNETDRAKAEAAIDKMCKGLLANTVVENYKFEIIE